MTFLEEVGVDEPVDVPVQEPAEVPMEPLEELAIEEPVETPLEDLAVAESLNEVEVQEALGVPLGLPPEATLCNNLPKGECEEVEFVSDVVLFTFFMLLLGLITKNMLRKIPIPYTGLLLILGLLFGFVHSRLRPEPRGACTSRLEGLSEEDDVWRRGYQHLGKGIEAWTSIEPELLLLIHLPALIFASAFTLDFHITKRNFNQILILAGPGVMIGTGLTAVVGKFIFPYDWCWPKALMFGAMLAATDPVAVVALLKEVGASAILGTVIEGESLFNDGTAFVFFLLFRDLIRWTTSCNRGECHEAYRSECELCECEVPILSPEGTDGGEGRRLLSGEAERNIFVCNDFRPQLNFARRDVGGSIRFFLRMALGGPLIGSLFGIAAATWINFVFNDMVVEVAITFVTAYLTYYTAEDLLSMSGVLSVVGLGITMTVFAKPRLSPKVHEPMEVFWEMVEYFANTMIFVYSGVKIAIVIYENAIDTGGKEKFIGGEEWGWAILLYILLQVIRLVTVFLCYPFMIMSGYKIHWKDAIVMIWGGLRGAVGLALSLIVDLDVERLDPKFRELVIFYMGLMAAMTLIINGTSMPHLLSFLGTTKPKPEKLEVLLHVVKELEEIGDVPEEPDELLGEPDTDLVKRLTKLKTELIVPSDRQVCSVMQEAANHHSPAALQLEHHLSTHLDSNNPAVSTQKATSGSLGASGMLAVVSRLGIAVRRGSSMLGPTRTVRMPDQITKEMLVVDFRTRVLTGVKSAYGEMNEEGELSADQHFYLKESADEALDTVNNPLSDWEHLEQALSFNRWRSLMNLVGKSSSKDRFMVKLGRGPLENFTERCFFIVLEKSAIMAVAFFHAHEEASDRLQEYIEYVKKKQEENEAEDDAARTVEEASSQVLAESQEESEKAIAFLKNMRHAYPEVLRAIKSKRSAWHILHKKSEYVEAVSKSGLVEVKEAQALRRLIEKKLKKLVYHPPKANLPESKSLLKSHPLFSEMESSIFEKEVWPHAKLKLYARGESIFEIGHTAGNLSLVVRGIVRLEFPGVQKASQHEGSGAMIGVSEVLMQERRSRSLVAETIAEVYQIDATVFREVARRYYPVRKRAWQMAGAFLTVQNPWGVCKGKTHPELQSIFRQAELVELAQHQQYRVDHISYLASGKLGDAVVEIVDGQQKPPIKGPGPLPVGPTYIALSKEAKILILPEVRSELHPGPRLGRLSTRSLAAAFGSGPLSRRVSLAHLSQRPSVLTRAASMRGGRIEHPLQTSPSQHLVEIPEGETNEAALQKAESEPQWRLEHATKSADNQLRQEVARNRHRMTRASTGVTPSRATYKEV